ncbi:MAG: DUF2497 domain-containing protein [Pseudomonadota bacterium]
MTKPDQSVSDIMASIRRMMADEDGSLKDDSGNDQAQTEEGDQSTRIEVDLIADEDEPLLLNNTVEPDSGSADDHDILLLTDPLDPVPGTEVAVDAPTSTGDSSLLDIGGDQSALESSGERIVSPVTEAAVAAALSRLTGQVMDKGAQGDLDDPAQAALEKLIRDALRPALRSWLDENLPPIVESVVEREVARLMNRQQGT